MMVYGLARELETRGISAALSHALTLPNSLAALFAPCILRCMDLNLAAPSIPQSLNSSKQQEDT